MRHLIYTSRLKADLCGDGLDQILRAARRNNPDLGVTGVLTVSDGAALQVLEGPDHALRILFDTIAEDPRHRDVEILLDRPIDRRRFGQWSMARLACVPDLGGIAAPDRMIDALARWMSAAPETPTLD